ncbi:hypothetical protein [Enterobacter roggenkampii]|uniref:hypothetical protein n=1 Tax=Enterobacter roggenkampii TaxID=1812935 RepID=UPI002017F05C|nr:hypothetical protein [Enterobacter roggenkampii]
MINERLTIERLSEVLKNMQSYTARERRIGEFDGGYVVERVDPTFIDCVSALAELLECRQALLGLPDDAIKGGWTWTKFRAYADELKAELTKCRKAQSPALRDVVAERQRQQSTKGYSTQQDDTYIGGELAAAAISYIEPMEAESYWPADWHDDSFKPSDYRRNLVKAGALILAEIERIDRQASQG